MSTEGAQLKTLAKKIGKYFVALLPYSTILSGVIIWSYLSSVGRVDLLMGAFSFNIGLISLLISAAVFSLIISVTLVMPSAILLAHSEFYLEKDDQEHNNYLPLICFAVSVIYLTLIFLLSAIFTEELPFSNWIIFIIIFLFAIWAAYYFKVGLIKHPFNQQERKWWLPYFNHLILLVNMLFIMLPGLSISIPAALLIHSSRSEGLWALFVAWAFMSLFAFLAFLPAIVHYLRNRKSQNDASQNSESNNSQKGIDALKPFLLTSVIAVICIVLLFPTLWSTLVFGSLVSIGLVDPQPHYYRVDDEKFSPALFPQAVWQTQEMPGRDEKAFFIRGVNLFSTGSVNLICPAYIVKLRAQATARDYANFIPGNNEASVRYFRQMMKGCVAFETGEIRRWDTLFDANGAIKK
ncbi:hypothetical protein SNN70_001749 [Cronobacter malonaticus]|nr:hypothetical protein [Cronobacter malonaticus]